MNLRTLDGNDEKLMLELLLSEKDSQDSDYYLDRGRDFWGPYKWFSKGKHYGLGVFDGPKLVGMAAVIKLPFEIKGCTSETFLATDMLIRPDYRKSFAAARLFTGLHTVLPAKDFINVWIENRVGFAEAIPKFSKRLNRSTVFPRETNLTTIYPNQNIKSNGFATKVDLTQDWGHIEKHLNEYLASDKSWAKWNTKIDIKDVFKKVSLFKIAISGEEIRGLIIDRSNLQTVRWNGQGRLLVEKYRRAQAAKNSKISEDDELPFANVGFIINSNPGGAMSSQLSDVFYQWGFENNYFGINFRDVNLTTSPQIDRAEFPRRLFLSSDQQETELNRFTTLLPKDGLVLESIYL